MNVAILFSGAKDSTFAIYKAIQEGHEVKYLVSMIPENRDSYMFHTPNIELVRLQSEALGIQLITKETKGEKERELDDLKEVLNSIKNEIQGVVSGALASQYQKTRIDRICEQLRLKSLTPSWGRNMTNYWEEIVKLGFEVIITKVAAEGLDDKWLGRKIDLQALKELKMIQERYGIHTGGEGGEYESLVLDGPIFKKKIKITKAHKEWDGVSGVYVIEKAELVEKRKT